MDCVHQLPPLPIVDVDGNPISVKVFFGFGIKQAGSRDRGLMRFACVCNQTKRVNPVKRIEFIEIANSNKHVSLINRKGDNMPIITIKTFQGKTREQKERWIKEITRVSMEVMTTGRAGGLITPYKGNHTDPP